MEIRLLVKNISEEQKVVKLFRTIDKLPLEINPPEGTEVNIYSLKYGRETEVSYSEFCLQALHVNILAVADREDSLKYKVSTINIWAGEHPIDLPSNLYQIQFDGKTQIEIPLEPNEEFETTFAIKKREVIKPFNK